MRKQWMVFAIVLLGLMSAYQNSHAQEIMCPMGASGSPASPPPPSYRLGVILVQFSDWATNEDARGGHCLFHDADNHYTYQMYYDLFFNANYRSPAMRTHDDESLFGCVKEFYEEISYGKFTFTANSGIINPTDPVNPTLPQWVTLPQTKAYWVSQSHNPQALLNAALAASGYSITGYDKIAVLYAGVAAGGGLQGAAPIGGAVYQVGEKTPLERGRTQTIGTFYGIGTHCHEFGHLLGLDDLQIDNVPWQRGLDGFDLMAAGEQGFMDGNHENDLGGYHAPTPLSGWSKLVLGWATYTDIATDQTINFPSFDENDNIFVRFVNDSDHDNWYEGEYFIIENRRPAFASGKRTFDGDMMNGLLIFHRANTLHGSTYLNLDVVEANGIDEAGSYIGSGKNAHLFPGTTNNTAFTPLSNPSSNIRNGPRSGFALTNIAVNGNGISADAYVNYLVSNSTDAMASNNARKLVRDSSGNYHLVYESEGEIYYQHSTTGTGNWLGFMRLSAGNGNNKFPSIAERGGRVYVAWQRFDGSSHDIRFRKSTDGGSTWANATEPASNVGANAPLPVIVTPATDKLTLIYRTGSNLGSRISANDGSSWSSGTVPSTGSDDNSPSLAWCDTYWGSNSRSPLVYARSSPATIYYTYYRNGPDFSGWGSTKDLSQIVPGTYNSHQKPSLASSGNSNHRRLHAVWEARNGTSGNYYVIIHRKATDWYTWPNVYSTTYYELQKEPSVTGLANDTAELLFKYATQNQIYKMHYNGSSWGAPVYIGAGRNPSASVGHTTAKYAWTEGSASPYRIKTSSETLSKAGELAVAYHRSVAVIDTATGAWLDLRLDKVSVKTKSGEERLVPLAPAKEDALTLTPANAFTNLVSSPATLPAEAESLLVTYRLGGQNLSDLRDEADVIDIRFVLSGQNGTTVALPVLAAASGNLEEKKLMLPTGISAFAANEVALRAEVKGLANKSSLIASLGHIYEFVEEPLPKALPQAQVPEAPEGFALAAYPNPFNPSTQIRFEMSEEGFVTLRIYNLQGQLVRELLHETKAAGGHAIRWDGRDDRGVSVTSGVYFIRFESGGRAQTSKLTVMR